MPSRNCPGPTQEAPLAPRLVLGDVLVELILQAKRISLKPDVEEHAVPVCARVCFDAASSQTRGGLTRNATSMSDSQAVTARFCGALLVGVGHSACLGRRLNAPLQNIPPPQPPNSGKSISLRGSPAKFGPRRARLSRREDGHLFELADDTKRAVVRLAQSQIITVCAFLAVRKRKICTPGDKCPLSGDTKRAHG